MANIKEIENVKYKECGVFNVALDFIVFNDDTTTWQVRVEWTDGAYPTENDFDKYDDAVDEYNRWGK